MEPDMERLIDNLQDLKRIYRDNTEMGSLLNSIERSANMSRAILASSKNIELTNDKRAIKGVLP
jgi:hypothetical protein